MFSVGPFTLVKTAVFKFAVFCLTIYTCPKNRELSAGTKLRGFLDRYCACPKISYFSFDWECLQLCVCVCVCVCVSCVCVSCMCVCLPMLAYAYHLHSLSSRSFTRSFKKTHSGGGFFWRGFLVVLRKLLSNFHRKFANLEKPRFLLASVNGTNEDCVSCTLHGHWTALHKQTCISCRHSIHFPVSPPTVTWQVKQDSGRRCLYQQSRRVINQNDSDVKQTAPKFMSLVFRIGGGQLNDT